MTDRPVPRFPYLSDTDVDEYCQLVKTIQAELFQVCDDFKLDELFFANVNHLCRLSEQILQNVDRAAWEQACTERQRLEARVEMLEAEAGYHNAKEVIHQLTIQRDAALTTLVAVIEQRDAAVTINHAFKESERNLEAKLAQAEGRVAELEGILSSNENWE